MNLRSQFRTHLHWSFTFACGLLLALLLATQSTAADSGAVTKSDQSVQPSPSLDEWGYLAEAGNPGAQFMLGEFYREGRGVEEDPDRALSFYLKAAYQGHGRAQYAAAGLLEPIVERENERDKLLSFALYMRAAVNGVTSAYVNISSAYCFGTGVDENPVIADIWMALALEPFADRLDVMQGAFCDIFGANDEVYLQEINRRAALLKEAYGLKSVPTPDE